VPSVCCSQFRWRGGDGSRTVVHLPEPRTAIGRFRPPVVPLRAVPLRSVDADGLGDPGDGAFVELDGNAGVPGGSGACARPCRRAAPTAGRTVDMEEVLVQSSHLDQLLACLSTNSTATCVR